MQGDRQIRSNGWAKRSLAQKTPKLKFDVVVW
jgi:hypothetical protein